VIIIGGKMNFPLDLLSRIGNLSIYKRYLIITIPEPPLPPAKPTPAPPPPPPVFGNPFCAF
jgi:hypothetical protein